VERWLPELADRQVLKSDKFGRHQDYVNFLEKRSVLGTTRRAFDALAALL
jgi:hypothetical protein